MEASCSPCDCPSALPSTSQLSSLAERDDSSLASSIKKVGRSIRRLLSREVKDSVPVPAGDSDIVVAMEAEETNPLDGKGVTEIASAAAATAASKPAPDGDAQKGSGTRIVKARKASVAAVGSGSGERDAAAVPVPRRRTRDSEEDDDDEDEDVETVEESPCGRYLKRREEVSFTR